ncbi:MAG TPA: hypothetical protein VI485_17385 [Vicinamibacterales bacterium]|nr:hypothetical protein [Vicinamibacterales bacterium]
MSDLFPDLSEFRHIPEIRVSAKGAVVGVCLGSALLWACPKLEEHHDHAPEREYAEVLHPLNTVAVNSTGGNGRSALPVVPLTWQNNSMFEAANVAIRAGFAKRDAQFRAAASAMSSNTSFLLNTTSLA